MRTDELIAALSADRRPPAAPMAAVWWGAAALAALLAGAVFFATIGPRPDLAAALQTLRFLWKIVVAIALAGAAFAALRTLARPEANTAPTGSILAGRAMTARALAGLLAAPLLLAAAVGLELAAVPPADWLARLIGMNNLVCLTYIPLIGLGPLAVFLAALRHGAPARPALAGAVAGLLAGGLAATFYAAHCTDDSPLFVAVWYSLAVAGLAGLGALVARRLVRW